MATAESRPFLARSNKPTPASLARALGRASPAYDALARLTASCSSEWNHSTASGWMLKIHDGKKALGYVVPLDGGFRVSLTVRPAERATLLADPAMAIIHDALAAAKKYVEGHALRFEVTDRATLAPLALLLERLIALRA